MADRKNAFAVRTVIICISFICSWSFTPMLYAEDVNTNQSLAAWSPDLNAKLIAAAVGGIPAEIVELIKAGADVDARHEDGRMALMLAASKNTNAEVVSVLLEFGSDAKAVDSEGKMALDYAKENKHMKNTDGYWKLLDASY